MGTVIEFGHFIGIDIFQFNNKVILTLIEQPLTQGEKMNIFSLDAHVWAASVLNALFLLVQLISVVRTRKVEGLSLVAFGGWLYIQIVYAIFAYREGYWNIFWGMIASATMSIILISLIIRWRK